MFNHYQSNMPIFVGILGILGTSHSIRIEGLWTGVKCHVPRIQIPKGGANLFLMISTGWSVEGMLPTARSFTRQVSRLHRTFFLYK